MSVFPQRCVQRSNEDKNTLGFTDKGSWIIDRGGGEDLGVELRTKILLLAALWLLLVVGEAPYHTPAQLAHLLSLAG